MYKIQRITQQLYYQQLKHINMYNFLKVVSISDLKQNAKGLKYFVIGFRPLTMLPNGLEVFSNQKEKTRTLFAANGEIKADPLYDDIVAGKVKIGALVEGSIYTFSTTQYQPEGFTNPVNSYSCVIFKGEDAVKYANRQLKQNYASVMDPSTGDVTCPENLEKPLSIEVAAPTSLQKLG